MRRIRSIAALSCGVAGLGLLLGTLTRCGDSSASAGACTTDQDGISGGTATFDVTVSDTGFAPRILKSENLARVTLTVRNAGTRPHDFVVGCIATPNAYGCPTTSCFPDAATIASLAPDASATTTFVAPKPEGIYTFRSDLGADTGDGGLTGQFILQ